MTNREKTPMSDLESTLAFQLRALEIPFEQQVKAIPGRRYTWDFLVSDLLIEVQGGIWRAKGAHNTGKAIMRDCEKLNLATLAGYRVLSFTADMVNSGEAVAIIEKAIGERNEP